MTRLVPAAADQIDRIYRESHPLWGAGLDLEGYRGLWDEVSATPWGARHASFAVWVDDAGTVLSSLKLYRPLVMIHGECARATVVGAIFTPAAMRGRGYAAEMTRAALGLARERGDRLVLLFSDIGTRYYEALGFHALPAEEQWGRLPSSRTPAPVGWSLRDAGEGDLDAIHEAHQAFCLRRPVAIMRDADHWHFLRVRSHGFFSRLRDPGLAQHCRVALLDGRFAGYLITVEGRGDWNVREIGAVNGEPSHMASIVRLGAHHARRGGLSRFYGWIPREVTSRLEGWKVRHRRRRRAVPMIFDLDGRLDPAALATPGAAFLPFQDQF